MNIQLEDNELMLIKKILEEVSKSVKKSREGNSFIISLKLTLCDQLDLQSIVSQLRN